MLARNIQTIKLFNLITAFITKQQLLPDSLHCWTEGGNECNTVAGCVSMCQQVLVIMTNLHCLL